MLVAALNEARHGETEDLNVMLDVLIYALGQRDSRVLLGRLKLRAKTPQAFVQVFQQQLQCTQSSTRVSG